VACSLFPIALWFNRTLSWYSQVSSGVANLEREWEAQLLEKMRLPSGVALLIADIIGTHHCI
jgi:hypothetical protein